MTLLILGVVLWSGAHFFKRLAPGMRARMGGAGKGVAAVLILISVVLMVIGYRGAGVQQLWSLGDWALSVNNLAMVIAVVLMGAGDTQSRVRGWLRHPMLAGMIVWSAAHLLVNGDLASVVLFGGLGIWAVVQMMLINRAEPAAEPFAGASLAGDGKLAVISLVVFAVIAGIHTWLGYWPFPG